ncbi:unnamed protein product [Rhizopus stolonifer]
MTGFSGSDDLLACFVAGNAFSWDDWFRQETEEAHFQEVIDMMLNLSVFIYIGAIIPWSDFSNPVLGLEPWRLVVIAILILLFRRLPIMLILKPVMPAMTTYREALFSGWFGPMGVGAVFLAMVAKEEMIAIYEESENHPVTIEIISPVVLFIVLSSTLVHGTTIPLFKIGHRIRTRTLSIASSGSGQVLRMPKLQMGRKSEEHRRPESQVRRNTMMNIQPAQHDEENLAEEDFLPDESDRTSGSEKQRPAGNESQSIRFLEPVNPRASSSASHIEKNQTSSLKSWLQRHEGSSGILNFFKSKPKEEVNTRTRNTLYELFGHHSTDHDLTLAAGHLNPEIEVWNEPHHVVIENRNDPSSQAVIDKSDSDWINKVKKKIKELQDQLGQERHH